MTFDDVVKECCLTPELVSQFNRLTGRHVLSNLYDTRPPIVKMIDESTGYQQVLDKKAADDIQSFISFVFECVWLPLLSQEHING